MDKETKVVKPEDIRIIVIDDSDLTRRLVMETLEAEKYNVVGDANNAESAVKLAHSTKCDIFIIDVVMPEISGIELIEHFQEVAIEGKVILMSSLNMESVLIDAISNGVSDFLLKPFTKEDLLKSVEKVANSLEE